MVLSAESYNTLSDLGPAQNVGTELGDKLCISIHRLCGY